MLRFAVICVAALSAAPLLAETSSKFRVEGDTLFYDTDNVAEGLEDSIEPEDVVAFRNVLHDNPNVRTLQLNSIGGSLWASRKMSDIIVDFGLDTHVHGDCASNCTRLFLAGTNRTMSRGSRIGFHQGSWSPGSIESYYAREAESEGWDTPWEFTSWVYADTQIEIYQLLSYMVDRGVDAGFAIATLKTPSGDMWYPYRAQLRAANVLTE